MPTSKPPKPNDLRQITAANMLRRSQLVTNPNQLEAMGGDIDLHDFAMKMRNKAGINTIDVITDATIERTISGASTLTVTLDDANHEVLLSGRLGRKVDVNIDGLFFTLVQVAKNGRQLTLTFEEREVNCLRYYNHFLMASRLTTTRAEFILKMIQEVKEVDIKWVIPELHVRQKISDVQGPNQVAVDEVGNPINTGADDATQAELNRTGGISTGHQGLTVKGDTATREQIKNANLVLATGVRMRANRKVLVSSIMTAIDESELKNLTYGDRDSVGVFQQRPSAGWPASRDVPTDAAAYFKSAISIDKKYPNLTLNDLCQHVQNSGTPYAYGAFEEEGNKFTDAYGIAGDRPGSAVGTAPTAGTPGSSGGGVTGKLGGIITDAANGMIQTSSSIADASQASSGQYFTRGTLSQKAAQSKQIVLTKEDSWTCMQRLANDVGWACFCVSGTIYFVSEKYLFQSKPFMNISEDTDGIDWIDFDYDEGKREATVTVTCHLSRWSAPPGSIVQIHNMGLVSGRWLVNDVNRSIFSTQGTITLKKPRPVLPEPTTLTSLPSGFTGPGNAPDPAGNRNVSTGIPGQMTDIQRQVISYAMGQLGVPYAWGAESPGHGFDCSGLTAAAYGSVGISLPHLAAAQYLLGPRRMGNLEPGDLVFFGDPSAAIGGQNPHHVGMYVGNGNMINAPHSGAVVRIDKNFRNTWPDYMGATCPWEKGSKSDNQSRQDKSRHGGNRG